MKPTTLTFLYAGAAAKAPLLEAFLSNTDCPRSLPVCTGTKLASMEPWHGPPTLLHYSSGSNYDNEVVGGSCDGFCSAALNAYKVVAQQDPLWYEVFVLNVLGEHLVEDIGLPKSISFSSRSTVFNLETIGSENEMGDLEDESSMDAKRLKSSLGNIMRATKPLSSKVDIATSSLESAEDGSSKESVSIDTQERTKENNRKDSKILSPDSLARPLQGENTNSEEAKVTEGRDLEVATENVSSSNEPPKSETKTPEARSCNDQSEQYEPDLIPVREGECEIVFSVEQSAALGETPTLGTAIQGEDTATTNLSKVDGPDPGIPNKPAKSQEEMGNVLVVATGETQSIIIQKAPEESASKSPTAKRNRQEDLAGTYQQKIQGEGGGCSNPDPQTHEKGPTAKVQEEKQDSSESGSLVEERKHRELTVADAAECLPIPLLEDTRVSQKQGKVPPAADTVSGETCVVVYHGWAGEHSVRKTAPLSKLCSLGYKKEEVLQLQSDAVEIILADTITKPKSGIPNNWRVPLEEPSSDVQVVTVSALKEQEIEEPQLVKERRQTLNGMRRRARRRRDSKAHLRRERMTTTSTPINPAQTDGTEIAVGGAKTNQSKTESLEFSIEPKPECKEGRMSEIESPAKERQAASVGNSNEGKQADAVVYFDAIENKMRKAPLEALASLGYSKDELLKLLPSALAAIVAEKIPKPRKGLSINWIDSNENRDGNGFDAVKVIPSSDADAMVNAYQKASRSRKMVSGVNNRFRREPEISGDRQRKLAKRRARSRERIAYHADGSKKAVYNGRTKGVDGKRSRVPDPHQGGWIGWMKYDKFRDLLRSEAEMRIRLSNGLGGDFSDAIKDECDLRLGMYEGWLRTLDRGIGQPIIPSRSERYGVRDKDEASGSGQGIIAPRNRSEERERRRRLPRRDEQ